MASGSQRLSIPSGPRNRAAPVFDATRKRGRMSGKETTTNGVVHRATGGGTAPVSELLGNEFSRRSFVKGGGALVVGFTMAASGLAGKAAASGAPNVPPDPTLVDSWLAINADNTVSVFPVYYEFGQGTWTGFVQLVAEELDVPVSAVKIPQWNSGGPNPFPNWGSNAASNGMANGGPPLRQAAATARQALLNLASTQLGVPVASLAV